MQTRSSYRKRIDQLAAHVIVMGTGVVEDILAASSGITGGDAAAVRDVIGGHAAAQRLSRSVEDACMGMMLLQQPVASDLRLVTASFRAVSDLDRIGEMAYQIALLAEEGVVVPPPLSHDLDALARQAARMVGAAIDAFGSSDVAGAGRVIAMDDVADGLYERIREQVVGLLRVADEPFGAAPEVLTVAKYYERMGDHAQGIADWAVFRATGSYRGRPMGETG